MRVLRDVCHSGDPLPNDAAGLLQLVDRRRNVDFRAGAVWLDPGMTKNGEARTFPFSAYPERTVAVEKKTSGSSVTCSTATVGASPLPWRVAESV
jgi:hypothetical protein